jgi:iron complex outermembrane receptor protein
MQILGRSGVLSFVGVAVGFAPLGWAQNPTETPTAAETPTGSEPPTMTETPTESSAGLVEQATPEGAGHESSDLAAMSLEDLLQIDITKGKRKAARDAPSVVSVITGDEIRNMGARNLMDVLQTVPGFEVVSLPLYGGHNVNIRGAGGGTDAMSKIKFMLNGHNLNTWLVGGSVGQALSTLPVANIERIELIRGPGSALYGTGAFLGVVNILTKKGGDHPTSISAEGGSFRSLMPHGEYSAKGDQHRIYVFAQATDSAGYGGRIESDAAGNNPFLASSAPGKTNTGAKSQMAMASVERGDVSLLLFVDKSKNRIPVGGAGVLTDENWVGSDYGYVEAKYALPLSDTTKLSFTAYGDLTKSSARVEIFPEETTALPLYSGYRDDEGIASRVVMEGYALGGEVSATANPCPWIEILGGAAYEYSETYHLENWLNANFTANDLTLDGQAFAAGNMFERFPNGMTNVQERGAPLMLRKQPRRNVGAVFARATLDIRELASLSTGVDTLSLAAGGRYDYYDDAGAALSPNVGLVYAPIESLYLKLLVGTAFRAPAFSELYLTNMAVLGNPHLKPETLTTYEAVVGFDPLPSICTSLTFFHTEGRHLIRMVSDDNPVVPDKYENLGRLTSDGIEVEARFRFDAFNYGYINATYQRVLDRTKQAPIVSASGDEYVQDPFHPSSIPEILGNLGVNVSPLSFLVANVWLNFVGERARSGQKVWQGTTLVKADPRQPTPGRLLVNGSLTFKDFLPNDSTEVQISGFNLLDQDYRDPDISGALEGDLPMPGRSFWLRWSHDF